MDSQVILDWVIQIIDRESDDCSFFVSGHEFLQYFLIIILGHKKKSY